MQMLENTGKPKHSSSADGFSYTFWLRGLTGSVLAALCLPLVHKSTKAAVLLHHCRDMVLPSAKEKGVATLLSYTDSSALHEQPKSGDY